MRNHHKDDFQNRVEIMTKIADEPNFVELEVLVPKDQASNLFATVNKREINVNLSRYYTDDYSDEGESTHFRKNQTVSKIIRVNDILSDKNISKVIMEDRTIFKIPKA